MKLLIEGVGKQYRHEVWGVRDVSLDLGSGIVGLLGPNGAGKSTLMRVLATITKPTRGRVTWNGVDIAKKPDVLRGVLGYLPQDFGVYPHLNAVEFLEYIAAIKGLSGKTARRRIDELLQVLNLAGVRKRALGEYSNGMRQRVGIAQALLNDPQLLIVDEPTVGLDPEERLRIRHLLSDLSGERIVVLSTHIVSDVEATATEIALLHRGSLLRHSASEELLRCVKHKVWHWTVPSSELGAVREKHLVTSVVRETDGAHVRIVADLPPAADAESVAPTLEDAYLYTIAGGGAGGEE